MKCKQCSEVYDTIFDEDFTKEICLPCQCQNRNDKWWGKVSKEISEYNHINSISYDFSSFCYDCSLFKIKLCDLDGYPELKKICKRECEIWTEYRTRNQQLQLF